MPTNLLDQLPDELIMELLAHIEPWDLQTFHALNTTDRRFHRLSLRHLYSANIPRNPEKFLCTIALPPPLGSPELASFVEHFTWSGALIPEMLHEDKKLLLASQLASLEEHGTVSGTATIVRNLRSPKLLTASFWHLDLILLFTPRIKSVEVFDAWHWDDHKYWFSTLAANPNRMSNLSSITIHGPLRLENVLPLFSLPSLRDLTLIEAVDMRRNLDTPFEWEDGNSPNLLTGDPERSCLERLTLRRSCINSGLVDYLPLQLPWLKALIWESADHELAVDPWEALDGVTFTKLIHNLSLNQDSMLETLRIRDEGFLSKSWIHGEDGPTHNPILLSKVRHLDIGPVSLHFVQDVDIGLIIGLLTPALETLHIQYSASENHQGIIGHFRDTVFKALKLHAPLKRAAIVWRPLAGWLPFDKSARKLQADLRALGIEFTVVYEDVFGEEPLVTMEGEEGWLLVQKTGAFENYIQDT